MQFYLYFYLFLCLSEFHSCRKCKHEFCWICMQDWSLHSNATGGFFQCNRHIANSLGDSNESLAEVTDEFGNAHLESRRNRVRGQKMAKFIQYYTQYMAHQESHGMEIKRMLTTMKRIKSSLVSSAENYVDPKFTFDSLFVEDYDFSSILWLQGDRVVHPLVEDGKVLKKSQCLSFLTEGFEELVRCREVSYSSFQYFLSVNNW